MPCSLFFVWQEHAQLFTQRQESSQRLARSLSASPISLKSRFSSLTGLRLMEEQGRAGNGTNTKGMNEYEKRRGRRYPQKNGHVDPNRDEPITMIIGSNNVFEVDCQSEALKIDDNNIIESKARVGRDMILSSGCVVGACCDVKTCEVLPENTVIYGNNCLRRLQSEKPQPQTLQLDFLMKILPNYHHLKRSPKPQTPPAKS
uniref:Dynactin subunit 6 n=1 Tax=Eptatretus burgeri TaxID=7764 RepID=A0A8C4NL55_EPTBU